MLKTWIIVGVSLTLTAILLFIFSLHKPLEAYGPILIAINITIAIFAINFSFLGYQFSPYRAFISPLSHIHILGVLVIFLASLIPIIFSILTPNLSVSFSIASIPIISMLGIILLGITIRENNPKVFLERITAPKKFNIFLKNYALSIEKSLLRFSDFDLLNEYRDNLHNWNWNINSHMEFNDPFDEMAEIGVIAIEKHDLSILNHVFQKSLDLFDLVYQFKVPCKTVEKRVVEQNLQLHAQQLLQRLVITLKQKDNGGFLIKAFININMRYLSDKALLQQQTQKNTQFILNQLTDLALFSLEYHFQENVMLTIIITRHIIQKGLQEESLNNRDYELSYLLNPILKIGSQAIKERNGYILHVCLDGLAWIGCTAIKNDYYFVVKECAKDLAQLGREARAYRLECYLEQCTIDPHDHAFERIKWMIQLLNTVSEDKMEMYILVFNEALSRLTGYLTTLDYKKDNTGQFQTTTQISHEPHKVKHYIQGQTREINYSDFKFLKDLDIY